jgi:hypothetical protein
MGSDATAIAAEPEIDAGWAEDPAASLAATFERDRHGFDPGPPPPSRKRSGLTRWGNNLPIASVKQVVRRSATLIGVAVLALLGCEGGDWSRNAQNAPDFFGEISPRRENSEERLGERSMSIFRTFRNV